MLLMLFLLSYRLLLSTIVVVRVVLVFTCVDVVAVSCCADNGFNVIFHGVLVSVVFVGAVVVVVVVVESLSKT